MNFISSPSGEYPTEGEKVQVRWRDKGTFEATLFVTSEDEHQLIGEMEHIIARQNQMAMAASKKSKERVQQKGQGQQLLSAIEAQQTDLRKENTELKKEVVELRAELKNHRKLGAYLKTAEKLVRHLKCQNCGSKVPVLNEEKNPSGDEMKGSITDGVLPSVSCDINQKPFVRRRMPKVVELGPGSAILVESSQLRSIETYSKTATATARGLLAAVFTQQALVICSVKGQRAKGSHRPSEQRPPLDVSAVTAILLHTKAMCKSRGWDYNEKVILLSLGTKLSEMRSGVKQLV